MPSPFARSASSIASAYGHPVRAPRATSLRPETSSTWFGEGIGGAGSVRDLSQDRPLLVYPFMRRRWKRRDTTPEAEAFGLFYDRHVDAVVAYFRRRTADAELALDLTAETFARVLAAAPREPLPSGGAATALLFTVARNLLIDSYRRGQVDDRARRSLALEPVVLTDRGLERVEEAAVAGESRIAELLAELPPEQREAIVARVVEEQPYPAIAAALRCSESVVRKRVSRGLATLRARIVEEDL